MFAAIVELDVRPVFVDAVEEMLCKLAAKAKLEKNNIYYAVNRSLNQDNLFVIYEAYKTSADWEAHLFSEAVQTALQQFDSMLLVPPRINLCDALVI